MNGRIENGKRSSKCMWSIAWECSRLLSFLDDCYGSNSVFPRSFKGNIELLLWVDLFSGYVIAKASGSRSAQTIAESYEECVFRRLGASEVIRHDRDTDFMYDFFQAFNDILGQKERDTGAYRPQVNVMAERMVQALTRALKMYVTYVDQSYWESMRKG